MSISEITMFIDSTQELTLKEKKIIKSSYPAVRRSFGEMTKEKEVEILTGYIAFVRIGLSIGA